ncbi:ELWxxDGT repeat protein [candidate division CSSED10-310 bacterium]|uniref:ELWxxDGT repeat protein n=1 Tax=candidate division CSSED10-310 bacterium TaxID=2855610 RepID=A0ABV6YYE0_UNCC1
MTKKTKKSISKMALICLLMWVTATTAYPGTTTYTYDAAGRLTKVQYGTEYLKTYDYDATGNFTQTQVLLDKVSLELSVYADPGNSVTALNINCPGDCEEYYDVGVEIELTANVAPSSTFLGWYGDISGSQNPISVMMDNNRTISAFFGSNTGDTDNDGVLDEDEAGHYGDDFSYDGDGNGVPDYLESNVASFHALMGGYVTLVVPTGQQLQNIVVLGNPENARTLPSHSFPYGFFQFEITGFTSCTTATLYLPLEPLVETVYNYGPTPDNPIPHWYEFTYDGQTGVELFVEANRQKLVFHFCDGERGDHDLQINGTIQTTIGPAGGNIPPTGVYLVKDINLEANNTYPENLANMNGTLYFVFDDGVHGKELWKSDGTPEGTMMVKDINPGESDSSVNYFTYVNGTVFFSAYQAGIGHELWKTNGTEVGTVLVKNINPGDDSAWPKRLVNVNGTLFFYGRDGHTNHGYELWKSDGTEAGTVMVKDINPGSASSDPDDLTNYNGICFFEADDGIHGDELWRSDGTEEGTWMVKDIRVAGSSAPKEFIVYNNKLFFTAYDETHGYEVWCSDGTEEGTYLLKDINPDQSSIFWPGYYTISNNILFFSACHEDYGQELWKTDGTEQGTVMVRDINSMGSSNPTHLVDMDGVLIFHNAGMPDALNLLYRSNGTEGGTYVIYNNLHSIGDMVYMNGAVYITGWIATYGYELYKTVGSWGVSSIDIYPGGVFPSLNDSDPAYLTPMNNTLYFTAYDGIHGREIYQSDGTASGTSILTVLAGTTSSSPIFLTSFNNRLFFSAKPGGVGFINEWLKYRLWQSDGTDSGTVRVKEDNEPVGTVYLTPENGLLYFAAGTDIRDELWRTDGTADGTILLKDFGNSKVSEIESMSGSAFIKIDDSYCDLWKSDGTPGGTTFIQQVDLIDSLTQANNLIFFSGRNYDIGEDYGKELWKTDGTDFGTVMVKDIRPGVWGSEPDYFTACGNFVYFSANDGINGWELWRSDGTEGGTTMVMDIYPGGSSSPECLLNVQGMLFFSAYDGTYGYELWKTDSQTKSTTFVKDINSLITCDSSGENPGSGSYPCNSHITNMYYWNGLLYFSATDGIQGQELWSSDGTPAGTKLVCDINPYGDSSPAAFAATSDVLFFVADNGYLGRELWSTSGTSVNTNLIADIRPGSLGSEIEEIVSMGDIIYFAANNGVNGKELWALNLSPVPALGFWSLGLLLGSFGLILWGLHRKH